MLWLHGIPGSGRINHTQRIRQWLTILGKSVLSAQLIRQLQSEKRTASAFYICSFQTHGDNSCSEILRAIATQLVRQSPDLSAYVYDEYILKGQSPSKSTLKHLVPMLLSGFPATRIVIDGLDETSEREQKEILSILVPFGNSAGGHECKIAIFSRDIPLIRKAIKKQPALCLRDEDASVNRSIQAYVHDEMHILRNNLDDSFVPEAVLEAIEQKLVAKADGTYIRPDD